jgi:FtsP/CotA-like multicopper oxidase with cupredoxin domain
MSATDAASIRPSAARYGHGVSPPASMGPVSLDGATRPPPPSRGGGPVTREFDLDVVEQTVPVAAGHAIQAWTFGGAIPGPILRANEGDRLVVRMQNRSRSAHNLHFHGSHEVEADGWEPVPPGAELTYRLTAAPFGLHPYHCDMTPDADHIGSGLYGVLIVDPPGGRPPAHEFVLALGGFDTDGDDRSDLCGWNGAAGFFAKYPIKVPAGELVRLYLVNMLGDEPLVSFHLHAQTFDVFRTGTRLEPDERTDVVSLGPTERAILEFRLRDRGRYMFHPHQRRLAERGAMGWLAAI